MQGYVYIDTFFLINFYMDYIILYIMSGILKITSNHLFLRRILAAFTGALYASLIVAFKLRGICFDFISYLGIVVVMYLIMCGKSSAKQMVKGVLFIYFFACVSGGLLHVLYYYTAVGFFLKDDGVIVLLFALLFMPAIIRTGERLAERISLRDTKMTVEIENGGKKIRVSGFLDTGNALYDPFFHKPVSIIESMYIEKLGVSYEKNAYHLIPFNTIGNDSGLIPVVRLERMTVKTARGKVVIEEPLTALYQAKLSGKGEYEMILHPEMLQSIDYK